MEKWRFFKGYTDISIEKLHGGFKSFSILCFIMTITVYRCAHHPEELNERFERLFNSSDTLLLELGIGEGYENQKQFMQRLSNSNSYVIVPDEEFSDYKEKLFSFIRNSRKQIELEKSPIRLKDVERIDKIYTDSWKLFYDGNLEEAIEKRLKFFLEQSEMLKQRDKRLVEHAVKINRENKDRRILIVIGADHDLHALHEKVPNVKQEFPYMPYRFNHNLELNRRIAFNKPYTRELVAKTFPEDTVGVYLYKTGLPLSAVDKKSIEISESLSFSDIGDLSNYISKSNLNRKMPTEATLVWLKNKGFEI